MTDALEEREPEAVDPLIACAAPNRRVLMSPRRAMSVPAAG